jgi:hypothetical protein
MAFLIKILGSLSKNKKTLKGFHTDGFLQYFLSGSKIF